MDLIFFMENTELVVSNYMQVINPASIEGKYVKSTWLCSQNVNLHCTCKKMYSPVLDQQRFCTSCSKWFHKTCMEHVDMPRLLQGQTAADHLKKILIMYKWGGDHQAEDCQIRQEA